METCVRGFSYMPQNSNKDENLQYIESDELERTWRVSRRQRLKEQEQKIWEEFVKEQDIVNKAYKEDPYQFLHELPENCMKELIETELQKMRKVSEEQAIIEQPNQGEGDHPTENQAVHTVTFAEEGDKATSNDAVFHIFDDDNELNLSGTEDDINSPNTANSPNTVRERCGEDVPPPQDNAEVDTVKSSENVTNLIENSINCARVKTLRLKINEEIIAIMASLEIQDVMTIDSEELSRRCRRSTEFCARFNRIYMYQLKRQMQEIERHSPPAGGVGLRTQFQAQMARLVALHAHLLQALQAFHKSFPQTWCLRECGAVLRALGGAARGAAQLCRAQHAPADRAALQHLCDDDLPLTCDKLDEAVNEYNLRVADFLSSSEIASNDHSSNPPSTRSNSRGKPKKGGRSLTNSKSGSTLKDARLSMYSLNTLRINIHGKASNLKDQSSISFRSRAPMTAAGSKSQGKMPEKPPKAHKIGRRPLMRAPAGGPARPAPAEDADIATLVEAVLTSPSSHMSREVSPRAPSPAHPSSRNSQKTTPRRKSGYQNTKPKSRRAKQKSPTKKNCITSSETQTSLTKSKPAQCAKKLTHNAKDTIAGKEGLSARNIRTSKGDYPKDVSHKAQDTTEGKDRNDKNTATYEDSGNSSRQQRGHIGSPGKDTGAICGGQGLTECSADVEIPKSPSKKDYEGGGDKSERDRNRSMAPAHCEVTRLVRQLCSPREQYGTKNEKVSGARNAQLLCIRAGSGSPPRQPSTPQLLRILEETIQKQAPKPMYLTPRNPDRFRLNFNIPEQTADRIFQYRTKFVQHMLTSAMYANSAVGKPWEMIGSVSEQIMDEVLMSLANEMVMQDALQELYKCETNPTL